MKKALLLSLLLTALTACNSTPVILPGPDMAPICQDNAIPGLIGCHGQNGPG